MATEVSADLTSAMPAGEAAVPEQVQCSLASTCLKVEQLGEGRVRRRWLDGIYWEGEEKERPMTGQGCMYFPGGPKLTGMFVDGHADGIGTICWQDGSCYEGEMKGSRRHGYGKYTWADGTVYEGEYVDDLRNGQGYYMASEYQYVGSWRDDSMEGEGVYECLDKRKNVIRIFQGTFEKQFPVSGTLQTSDGQIHEVCYDGATLVTGSPWLWKSNTEEEESLLMELSDQSEEYEMVSKLFYASLPAGGPKITNISRIQNPGLRDLYQIQRNRIRNEVFKRGQAWNSQTMERWAFHGTGAGSRGEDPLSAIMNEGFMVTLAGSKNGMVYGAGTYFARDSSYSTTYCHHVPGKGSNERSMLLARIVVGRYTQGHISYRVPPVDPSGSAGQHFHSMVNDTRNPSIFVISHSASAYPAYKIDFTTSPPRGTVAMPALLPLLQPKADQSRRGRRARPTGYPPLQSVIAKKLPGAGPVSLRSRASLSDGGSGPGPAARTRLKRNRSEQRQPRDSDVIDLTKDSD